MVHLRTADSRKHLKVASMPADGRAHIAEVWAVLYGVERKPPGAIALIPGA